MSKQTSLFLALIALTLCSSAHGGYRYNAVNKNQFFVTADINAKVTYRIPTHLPLSDTLKVDQEQVPQSGNSYQNYRDWGGWTYEVTMQAEGKPVSKPKIWHDKYMDYQGRAGDNNPPAGYFELKDDLGIDPTETGIYNVTLTIRPIIFLYRAQDKNLMERTDRGIKEKYGSWTKTASAKIIVVNGVHVAIPSTINYTLNEFSNGSGSGWSMQCRSAITQTIHSAYIGKVLTTRRGEAVIAPAAPGEWYAYSSSRLIRSVYNQTGASANLQNELQPNRNFTKNLANVIRYDVTAVNASELATNIKPEIASYFLGVGELVQSTGNDSLTDSDSNGNASLNRALEPVLVIDQDRANKFLNPSISEDFNFAGAGDGTFTTYANYNSYGLDPYYRFDSRFDENDNGYYGIWGYLVSRSFPGLQKIYALNGGGYAYSFSLGANSFNQTLPSISDNSVAAHIFTNFQDGVAKLNYSPDWNSPTTWQSCDPLLRLNGATWEKRYFPVLQNDDWDATVLNQDTLDTLFYAGNQLIDKAFPKATGTQLMTWD